VSRNLLETQSHMMQCHNNTAQANKAIKMACQRIDGTHFLQVLATSWSLLP
jgi:hypothetical protein